MTSNAKRLFGLIGYPLSHSFSQRYFTEKFAKEKIANCEFRNFPIERIEDFAALISQHPDLSGLSVTIPYKESVIRFLDALDPSAKEIGAVNCIRIQRSPQRLTGFNTDVTGFERSLKPLLRSHHSKALVLGSGGASKAIQYVLKKLNIDYILVSRAAEGSGTKKYAALNKQIIASHPLIINTTPLGMYPKVGECPEIPYEHLTPQHLLFDLTYNPEETLFLKKGKEKGAQVKNGLEMLQLQAERAWDIWNGKAPGH